MAGSATIGALNVKLGIDSAQFNTGLTRAQRQMQAAGDRMKKIGATLATAGIALGAAAAAGLVAATRRGLEYASSLGEVSQQLGVTTKDLQVYRYAASQAGIEQEEMDKSLAKLTVNIGKAANGSKPAAAAFAALGLSVRDANGNVKSAGVLMPEIADALARIPDAASRAAAEVAIFGKSGQKLDTLLAGGSAQLNGLTAAAEKLGLVLSSEDIAKADEAADKLGTLKQVFDAKLAAMVGQNADAIIRFVDGLLQIGAAAGEAFGRFNTDVVPGLMAFGKAVAENLGPTLVPMLEAGRAAGKALADLFIQIFGGEGGTAGTALKNFGDIVGRVISAVTGLFTGALNAISNVVRAIAALLRGDFGGALNALGSAVASILGGIGRAFVSLFPEVVDSVKKMVNGVQQWITGKLFDVLNGVIHRVKWVSDAFFKLYDAVVGHSYVPDMVKGIAEWMAKLDAGMVVPARNATEKVRTEFESLRDDLAGVMEGLLTDSERAVRQLAKDMATLDRSLRQNLITRSEYDAAVRLRTTETLTPMETQNLTPLEMPDVREAMRNTDYEDAAKSWADAFAYNMEGVLRGDIKGVFNEMLGDVLQNSLRGLGSSLFKAFSSKGGGLGSIFSAIGNFIKLPGFKTGGSFKVGGGGGIDSSVVAFRATPGEMVDVRRPGQSFAPVGPSLHFDLSGAVMTEDLLNQMQQIGRVSEGRAVARAGDQARRAAPGVQNRLRKLGTV